MPRKRDSVLPLTARAAYMGERHGTREVATNIGQINSNAAAFGAAVKGYG